MLPLGLPWLASIGTLANASRPPAATEGDSSLVVPKVRRWGASVTSHLPGETATSWIYEPAGSSVATTRRSPRQAAGCESRSLSCSTGSLIWTGARPSRDATHHPKVLSSEAVLVPQNRMDFPSGVQRGRVPAAKSGASCRG